jgi:hypothetical protein
MAETPETPATPESGSGTSIEKFKTPEERDRAYVELERLAYSQTQRLADLERKLEGLEQPAPAPERSFTELYPSSQPKLYQRETELASRLLTEPSRVLREHAEFVRQNTIREVEQLISHQDAIARFKQANPDLAAHEEIVGMFVRKQPSNLSPSERLKRAAPEARAYIASLARNSNQASTTLDPATYVEAPTSRSAPAAPSQASQPTEDDDLSEMIRERSALQNKKRL